MDIDTLLHPIRPDAPFGDDLSFSLEFDTVREKRREDDASLAQGEWKKSLKVADWPGVAAQCEDLLRQHTKDLRVAGWYTDALARTRGFAGLADGLALCAGLCEQQWDGLHPQAVDGDQEQRTGSLAWLLAQVGELTRGAPILLSGSKRVSLRDIEGAKALQQQLSRGLADAAAVAAKGSLTMEDVNRIQASTPPDFLRANVADVQRAADALGRLETAVDARLGADGPGFSAARKALADACSAVERLAHEAGAATPGEGPSPGLAAGDPGKVSPATSTPALHDGPLQSRAEALRQLRVVAEFFRRTEPHSPVAYLAERAAQWGEMPLHAWLRVVLKDPGALANVEELLGVAPPPAAE
jgi:type VI secretion system protein ImpA